MDERNKHKFNFLAHIENSLTLMVGEGNISFALSLALNLHNKQNLIVSVFENKNNLSNEAKQNADKLLRLGIKVIYEVNARNLKAFKDNIFDIIIFQFPNSGSRIPLWDRNPNFILIKQFLKCARGKISNNGKVAITSVDNSYYDEIFEFESNAKEAGFTKMSKFIFDPKDFQQYKHTMAHNNQSGINKYDKFITRVFT